MSSTLSWNYRGLGSIPAINALRRVVINERPWLVFIQETKLHQAEMEHVRMKLKCKGMIAVECVGEGIRRKRGLALL